MPRIKTLVLILAGGAGGRLELLTHTRAKPAVPFAGTHRLIDFPLSNCHNSRIDDVWISQQFNPVSLSDHVSNGRPWDLDRTSGGLLVLHPRQGNEAGTGFQDGTGEALWSQADLIRQFDPDALVVLSADAVYKLDYYALAEEHCKAGKAVTMVTTEVEPEDADRYGVVQLKGDKVTDYVYKPDEPKGSTISNEVFVFTPEPVLKVLDELEKERGQDDLDDLGHYLLPRLVDAGEARAHPFDGYWRDVGTIDAFHECHMELVEDEPPIDLDDPALADPHARDREPRLGTGVLGRLDRVLADRPGSEGRRRREPERARARRGGRKGRHGARLGAAPGRDRARRRHRQPRDHRRPRGRARGRGGARRSDRANRPSHDS